MTPLLYKAHPLLFLTIDLAMHPLSHSWGEVAQLLLIYLSINMAWALWLILGVKKSTGVRLSYLHAYALALPALVFYLPLAITLTGDVLAHEFHYAERFIPVFCLFVASQMLAVYFGSMVKYPRNQRPAGLHEGLAISLFLLLGALPFSLALLWLDQSWHFF
jgi:hypothetical protein